MIRGILATSQSCQTQKAPEWQLAGSTPELI